MSSLPNRAAAAEDALAEALREGLRSLAKAVTVITCRHGDARYAMTATAVSELSLAPPSMIICVNKTASLYAPLIEGADFCINILSTDQEDVAKNCTGATKGEARFALGDWSDADQGPPRLEGAQTSIVCRNVSKIEHGTHAVFVGDVAEVWKETVIDPLLYVDRRFSRVG